MLSIIKRQSAGRITRRDYMLQGLTIEVPRDRQADCLARIGADEVRIITRADVAAALRTVRRATRPDCLPANVREAMRLTRTYLGGRCELFALAGPAKRSCRKHILEVLRGAKVKANECGINALEAALYEAAGVRGSCGANRARHFFRLAAGV
jgi:hypothetical protein